MSHRRHLTFSITRPRHTTLTHEEEEKGEGKTSEGGLVFKHYPLTLSYCRRGHYWWTGLGPSWVVMSRNGGLGG
jgi:hypothetical protein